MTETKGNVRYFLRDPITGELKEIKPDPNANLEEWEAQPFDMVEISGPVGIPCTKLN